MIPETFYWFGDNNYTEWEELFKQYNPPPYRLPRMTGAYSFGVAGIDKFNCFNYVQRIFVETRLISLKLAQDFFIRKEL